MEFKGFTEKQKTFLLEANSRWNFLTGAVRSGKTFATFFKILLRIQEHYNNNVLFVGKTLNTLDRNIFDSMRSLFGDEHVSKIINNREIIIFGKKCYCVGANDDRAVTKIQGMSVGYCYADEVTTWPENFFEMLKSRLDLPNSKFDGTCNPEGPSHFVKKHLDNGSLDVWHQHFTIYDNPHLTPDFVRNLENEYRGTVYFDKWILGKWTASEGLVYPLFHRVKHFLTPSEFTAKVGRHFVRHLIIGVDGATTNDSTALVPLAVLDNGRSVVLEMFYHNPKINGPLSNEQLVPYIQQYLDDLERKYGFDRAGVTYYMPVDCASADLVLTLQYNLDDKYNVVPYKKKSIQATTDVVNNALGRNAIYIMNYGGYYNYPKQLWEKGDNQLCVDLESMVWDKNNKNYNPSIPNDVCDAFRYACCVYYYNPANLWETPSTEKYFD